MAVADSSGEVQLPGGCQAIRVDRRGGGPAEGGLPHAAGQLPGHGAAALVRPTDKELRLVNIKMACGTAKMAKMACGMA